jgi:hypothetical protein
MTALTILYSFLSSVWVLPSMLVIWARSSGLAKNLNENMMPEAKDKYEKSKEDVEDTKEYESEAKETEDDEEPEDAKNDIAIPKTDED